MPPKLREDDAFLALLNGNKLKEARNHLDKKLKKASDDPLLLLYKAELLVKSEHIKEARDICKRLCATNPPITDLDLLRRIDKQYPNSDPDDIKADFPELQKLWDNAIKAQGGLTTKEVDIAQEWVHAAISRCRWSHVRSASKAIHDRTTKQKQRKYFMWQVVARYMENKTHIDDDQKLSNMHLKLASMMLAKLSEKDPAKNLTSQEFKMLMNVLIDLQDDKLPELLNNDWTVVKAKLAFFESGKHWRSLLKFAREILEEAATNESAWKKDDWALWGGLVEGENKLACLGDSDDITKATKLFLSERATTNPKMRGANKALIALLTNERSRRTNYQHSSGTAVDGRSDLLAACDRYFKSFASHTCCFKDLRDHVSALNDSEWITFRRNVSDQVKSLESGKSGSVKEQLKWLAAEINALKFDYMMKFSVPALASSKQELLHTRALFINQCLHLYKIARIHSIPSTDPQPGDEAIHLAFMALAGCARHLSNEGRFLLFSACLLDLVVRASKHSKQTRVFLVEIYQHLGLGSLALATYDELGVRGILTDNMAPVMFANVAVMYPCPRSPQSVDPYQNLRHALLFYEKTHSEIPDFQKDALDKQNYEVILELDSFRQHLERSSTRQMLILEARRMLRLRGLPEADKPLAKVDSITPQIVSSGWRLKNYELPGAKAFSLSRTYFDKYLEVLHFIDKAHGLLWCHPEALDTQAVDDAMATYDKIVEGDTGEFSMGAVRAWRLLVQFLNMFTNVHIRSKMDFGAIMNPPPNTDMNELLEETVNIVKTSTTCRNSMLPWPAPGVITAEAVKNLDLVVSALEWLKACYRLTSTLSSMPLKASTSTAAGARIKASLKVVQRLAESEFRLIQDNVAQMLTTYEKATARKLHDACFVEAASAPEPESESDIARMVLDFVPEDERMAVFASILSSIKDTLHGVGHIRIK